MKKKPILIIANLLCAFSLWAQWPAPTTLNTANLTPTSTKTVGLTDSKWTVSINGISGTYVPAVSCGIAPGCCWASSTSGSANWITFPHKSTYPCVTYPTEAEHFCIGPVDEFYKLTFNLPASACGVPYSSYCLKMKFNADNCVYKIYVNGTSMYTSGSGSPYVATDYMSSTGTTQTFCSGWQAGANTIIVHVKSGGPTAPDHTGFLAEVDLSGTTAPCEEPSTGCCLGNICGSTQNALAGNYEIPMNSKNFNFTNPKKSNSQVFIGYSSCNSSSSRLDVTDDFLGTGVRGYCSTPNKDNIGVHGLGYSPSADRGVVSVGVLGETGMDDKQGNQMAGVAGFCGGAAILSALPTSGEVGVYGNATANGGRWAGYFDGDVNFSGTVFGSQMGWTSDKRFKSNIKGLENMTEKISRLNGYTYTFKTAENKNRNFPAGEQIGLLAQELQEVFPQLVFEDKQGFLAVNYVGLIPVLIESAKEQQSEIRLLKQQLNQQKTLIDQLMQKAGTSTGINQNSPGTGGFSMLQNEPNPFSHETVIRYTLPQQVNTANLVVYDLTGKQIASFPVTEKGASSITITSEKLAAGIYIYSIVADGKIVDSKRMIVAEK